MTTTVTTNTKFAALAEHLASAVPGTFTSVTYRKVGTERGKGADRKRYGDDLVNMTLVTGVRYLRLVQRSLNALRELDKDTILAECKAKGLVAYEGRGDKAVQVEITADHVHEAFVDLDVSYTRTLEGTSTVTSQEAYEPLVVEGRTIRGAKVHKDTKETHLEGIIIRRTVVEPAVNGAVPESKSGPVVVVKDFITHKLPVGKFIQIRCSKENLVSLKVGGLDVLTNDDLVDTDRDSLLSELEALLADAREAQKNL